MKAQTRKNAATESAVNLAIGFSMSWGINYVALVWLKLTPTASMLFVLGGAITIASVVRSYCMRRVFERLRIRQIPPAFLYIVEELARERHRQIGGEGYDLAHDDAHVEGHLADAAAAYCLASVCQVDAIAAAEVKASPLPGTRIRAIRDSWPWDLAGFKPVDQRRSLVKAGALLIAEIGRIDRAQGMRL